MKRVRQQLITSRRVFDEINIISSNTDKSQYLFFFKTAAQSTYVYFSVETVGKATASRYNHWIVDKNMIDSVFTEI